MELQNNRENKMTLQIMEAFDSHSKSAIVPLEAAEWNRVFSHVNKIVANWLASDKTPQSDGGFINERKIEEK